MPPPASLPERTAEREVYGWTQNVVNQLIYTTTGAASIDVGWTFSSQLRGLRRQYVTVVAHQTAVWPARGLWIEALTRVGTTGHAEQQIPNTSYLGQEVEDRPYSTYFAQRERALNLPVAELLNELALSWGVAWADVARVVGVSVPALRKWRRQQSRPNRGNRERLAALSALLTSMREQGIAEPAGRMNVRLLDGYSITLRDAIRPERAVEDLLNQVEPNWRDRFATRFEVFRAADGDPAIRLRKDPNS
jgi:hypothetical protein